MVLKVFSIRDAKAEVYKNPMYCLTHGDAERTFHRLVNDKESMVNRYPEDFDLYYLGEWDDNTGKVKWMDTPQHLQKAVALIQDEAQ